MNILSAGILLTSIVVLSACNDQKSSSEQQTQSSADQQEIAKFNAYVEVANSLNTPFAKTLSDHQQYIEPKLKSGEKLDSYSVAYPFTLNQTKQKLTKAIALPHAMPEIDGPAKSFEDALSKFQPINTELSNYADSKGYLADGGKKAREQDDAYVSTLTEVVKAEEAFLTGIEKQDEINTREAFDKAQKDTQDYFRAGLILYAKQALRLSYAVFQTAGSKETVAPFRARLDQAAAMADGWGKKIVEADPNGCPYIMNAVNDFVAEGRQVVSDAEAGKYVKKADDINFNILDPIGRGQAALSTRYNNMINVFNNPHC
ncbi:DUF3829 domain-containing protein [Pleomorphomonas sp. JP5]|uniref:DUF3829 domain-containing protein n=1 Tax=Pleomorphomonas sp. JP5 TaxID=2942998 RepID=UPI002044C5A6|nr:DUF3829 domain-containing protein [Pleomorphomonas sp. JP5]MCM5556981.1 YiiG family protein [Pleomorphomonas sp. JP5]